METSITKKARFVRLPRITDLAVPIRLHIYGFLKQYDVWTKLPDLHGEHANGLNYCGGTIDLREVFWNLFWSTKVELYTIETAFASILGDLELLQYLQDMPQNPWLVQKCDSEDKRNFFCILHMLMLGYGNHVSFHWARRNQFPWNQWTFEVAMRKGLDIDILQWLHTNGCPLSTQAFAIAASWRDLNVLQWLLEIQCPWRAWTFACAVRERRDWEVLIWLKTHGCPWDEESLNYAIKNNDNLLLVEYLLAEKCPTDACTARYAIDAENVVVLKLLGDAEYTFDEEQDDFWYAIYQDKPLEILQALHSIDCPLEKRCFREAIIRGDMEILRWLRAVGCPWDESTFVEAIEQEDIEIIRWLYEEKCPRSSEAAFDALMKKYLQLAE